MQLKHNKIPIRSEALLATLRSEDKFQKIWTSLSKAEQKVYLKANSFYNAVPVDVDNEGRKVGPGIDSILQPIPETIPTKIDQFQGKPHIKEYEDQLTRPAGETTPTKIDQFQHDDNYKKQSCIENIKIVDENPNTFSPNEMDAILHLLTKESLVDPLPAVAFMSDLKRNMKKVGTTIKQTPTVLNKHANKFSENTKKAAADWSAKSHQEKINHASQHIGNAIKNVVHHTKHVAKHEIATYHGVGKALGHLATGKKWKDLHPEHKKALKHALVHAGITAGSMAMGDATGGGVGHLLANFAADHLHHSALLSAGHVALKSGKDAYKKATSAEKKLTPIEEKDVQKIIQDLIKSDIPETEWLKILKQVEDQTKKKRK